MAQQTPMHELFKILSNTIQICKYICIYKGQRINKKKNHYEHYHRFHELYTLYPKRICKHLSRKSEVFYYNKPDYKSKETGVAANHHCFKNITQSFTNYSSTYTTSIKDKGNIQIWEQLGTTPALWVQWLVHIVSQQTHNSTKPCNIKETSAVLQYIPYMLLWLQKVIMDYTTLMETPWIAKPKGNLQ